VDMSGESSVECSSDDEWNIMETNTLVWKEDMVNDYRVIGELGKGSFGIVKKCQREVGPEPFRIFALKFLSKKKLRKCVDTVLDDTGFPCRITGIDKLNNEINLMRRLFHRNVSILFEVIDDSDEDSVVLVTEYMAGGAVMNYVPSRGVYQYSAFSAAILKGQGKVFGDTVLEASDLEFPRPMTNEECASLFCDLLEGVSFLHSKGICHRDLKPDNLLVHESGSLRISDFGCAVQLDLQSNPRGLVSNTVGTLAFWPPEALLDPTADDDVMLGPDPKEYSAFDADAWAVGMVLHCFLYGKLVFPLVGRSHVDIIQSILAFNSSDIDSATSECDYNQRDEAANYVWKNMLIQDRDVRWNITNAMHSEWICKELQRRKSS